ncbi:DUF3489 domain-containing protein [Sphingomonas aerophila]|uniref:DUF3489 domain-containing protein n=1 Tax=Sphingomonas aerophila TaxID=1344948 RepID=A0A7W9BG47_9SPHN|nr:DUF3489 domain-containing protein [Sphingomonas aerophila]MBB5716620.1 hypothetical protein [Sphingomonas aerophila]
MIKLTDTQAILLAAASQRPDGSLVPIHASIKPGGGAAKAIANLLRDKLAEERETTNEVAVRRVDGDIRYGVFITDAGLTAIGITGDGDQAGAGTVQLPEIVDVEKAPTKIATVLALLDRAEGSPMATLTEATGWLPHTIRAAMTGLRKKGHPVQRIKRDGMTCYRLFGAK